MNFATRTARTPRSGTLPFLAFACLALTGCLEVEHAHACNRMGQQIATVFAEPKALNTRTEVERMAQQMETLAKDLAPADGRTPPAQAELEALRKELRETSAELKRWLAWFGTPGGAPLEKRATLAAKRLQTASQAFARACH